MSMIHPEGFLFVLLPFSISAIETKFRFLAVGVCFEGLSLV
jgi:hypothetical protein